MRHAARLTGHSLALVFWWTWRNRDRIVRHAEALAVLCREIVDAFDRAQCKLHELPPPSPPETPP